MVVDLVTVLHLMSVNSYIELRFMFYEPSDPTILHLFCYRKKKIKIKK